MTQLAALMRSLPAALRMHQIGLNQELEETRKNSERKLRTAQMRRAGKPTRDELREAERAKWLAEVLEVLKDGQPVTTVELGAAMGTTRMAAYRRLFNMEQEGHVHRIGVGVSTRWLISERK